MAALANEGANLTWQRVQIFLLSNKADEAVQLQFKQLRMYLATQQKNPQLQFLSFADADITGAGGIQLGTGTPLIYAFFVIKNGTSGTGTATASYVKLYDDATNDTTAANQRVILSLQAAADSALYMQFNPAGTARFANGVVVGADTTANGTTDSTAGDAGPGFVLVG